MEPIGYNQSLATNRNPTKMFNRRINSIEKRKLTTYKFNKLQISVSQQNNGQFYRKNNFFKV